MIRMESGYAYKRVRGNWDIVVVSENVTGRARFVGFRDIDGSSMALFQVGKGFYAQTAVGSRHPSQLHKASHHRGLKVSRLKSLRQLGFDETRRSEQGYRVKCSQCEALVINGVPTHEGGCPNKPRAHDEDEARHAKSRVRIAPERTYARCLKRQTKMGRPFEHAMRHCEVLAPAYPSLQAARDHAMPSIAAMIEAEQRFTKRLPDPMVSREASRKYVKCFERWARVLGKERAHKSCIASALDVAPHYSAGSRRRIIPFVSKQTPQYGTPQTRPGFCMYCDNPTFRKKYKVCVRCADIIEGRRMGDVGEIAAQKSRGDRAQVKSRKSRHARPMSEFSQRELDEKIGKMLKKEAQHRKPSPMPPYRLAKCVGKKVIVGMSESMAVRECDEQWTKIRALGKRIRAEVPKVQAGYFARTVGGLLRAAAPKRSKGRNHAEVIGLRSLGTYEAQVYDRLVRLHVPSAQASKLVSANFSTIAVAFQRGDDPKTAAQQIALRAAGHVQPWRDVRAYAQ